MLLVGAGRARLAHNSAASQNQLRWIAGVTASYAADHQNRMWALSWKAGVRYPTADPALSFTESPQQAVANQAIDLMRRRTGRTDIPRITGWVAFLLYSHLPLADYLDTDLPLLSFVSPADEHRLKWARDPEAFDLGAFLPFQPDPIESHKRWPYSASYQAAPALVTYPWSGPGAVYQSGHDQWLTFADTFFEGLHQQFIAFPSQKAMVYDWQSSLGASDRYFLDERASTSVLCADGSAELAGTSQSNPGWQPAAPGREAPLRFRYEPRAWEPQAGAGEYFIGHYRWTRCGAFGRDFGGPELCPPKL